MKPKHQILAYAIALSCLQDLGDREISRKLGYFEINEILKRRGNVY